MPVITPCLTGIMLANGRASASYWSELMYECTVTVKHVCFVVIVAPLGVWRGASRSLAPAAACTKLYGRLRLFHEN